MEQFRKLVLRRNAIQDATGPIYEREKGQFLGLFKNGWLTIGFGKSEFVIGVSSTWNTNDGSVQSAWETMRWAAYTLQLLRTHIKEASALSYH